MGKGSSKALLRRSFVLCLRGYGVTKTFACVRAGTETETKSKSDIICGGRSDTVACSAGCGCGNGGARHGRKTGTGTETRRALRERDCVGVCTIAGRECVFTEESQNWRTADRRRTGTGTGSRDRLRRAWMAGRASEDAGRDGRQTDGGTQMGARTTATARPAMGARWIR